jgi:uncharacterized protein YjhX (UPF0386 family)
MNISRIGQRVLHLLAQGGAIRHQRDPSGRVVDVTCFTREGYGYADCSLAIFQELKRKRLIASREGAPYRITREGRLAVRARPDNR